MTKYKLDIALNKVSEFIKSLGSVEEISRRKEYDLFFSLSDEGTLFFKR